ncbi:AMP-binding protein [Paenibacillus sp. S-38]|uniref:AMP-binding protein n=1 Tax=Paenibacillus sp. S-38 TaxID=3416710 RepID=UPI003CF825D8
MKKLAHQGAPPAGPAACLAEPRTGPQAPGGKTRGRSEGLFLRQGVRTGRSVHRSFAEQAEAVPLFPAVVYRGMELRYRELNLEANRVARRLAERGVGRGQLVALAAEPSPALLTGLLGILKSGAACLLDDTGILTEGPDIRGFSGAAVGMVTPGRRDAVLSDKAAGGMEWLILDDGLLLEGEAPEAMVAVEAGDEAVVCCRPSSLGPRVTRLSHGTLYEACRNEIAASGITSSDSAVWSTACGSAAFVRSALPFVMAGADVHLLSPDVVEDLPALHRYLGLGGITAAFLPEEACASLLAQGRLSLRHLFAGGQRWKRLELPARRQGC